MLELMQSINLDHTASSLQLQRLGITEEADRGRGDHYLKSCVSRLLQRGLSAVSTVLKVASFLHQKWSKQLKEGLV